MQDIYAPNYTLTNKRMHIAITGNIGAGKTTLAEKLAAHYGWEMLPEAVDGNPYLADFYEDMPRWSFSLQVYFLNSRFVQSKKISAVQQANQEHTSRKHTLVQDRTIYEDSVIFARNLFQSGYMSGRDYETYQQLFQNMINTVRPPDLMIYLRADLPKLSEHIKQRGRAYEQAISDEYLSNLNRLYEEFVDSYTLGPLLILDVNTLDYANNAGDLTQVIDQVDSLLFG